MSASDNLLRIHATDGAILRNSYGNVLITSKTVGELYLPTGEIVMGDPLSHHSLNDISRKTFSKRVEPGSYPFVAYISEGNSNHAIAFTELRFSDSPPVKFSTAKTKFDAAHHRKGFCGYAVRDSRTGIMDADVFKIICKLPRTSYVEELIDFDQALENINGHSGLRCGVGSSADGNLTAAILSINSGIYYWYWGLDHSGNICCLMADFFTFY